MASHVSTILSFVLVGTAALAACNNSSPPVTPPTKVPPQLVADPATIAAMKDPKFAEFRGRVRALRAASNAMSEFLASIGGKPKDDGELARYRELDAAIAAKKAAVDELMNDAATNDADRKVMRVLFAAPASALTE